MSRLIIIFCVCALRAQASAVDTEVAAFWEECLPSLPEPPADDFYRVKSIGSSPKARDAITELILQQRKTGTFTSPWIYQDDPSLTPVVGGYWVLTDSTQTPRAVMRTSDLKTLPFNEITEQETAVDGPALRRLEAWRSVHVAYFSRELKPRDKAFEETMPITMETFEVVCRGG